MTMIDEGTPHPEFQGAQSAPTPEQLRAQQAAIAAAQQQPTNPPPPPQPQGPTAEQLAAQLAAAEAARQADAARIAAMESDLAIVRQEREAAQAAAAEQQRLAAEAAEAQRLADQEKMTAKELIMAKDAEWTARFNAQQEAIATSNALLERERRYNALMEYRSERLKVEAEHIIPQLIDNIMGEDEAGIDAAIERAKAQSQAIFADVQAAQQQQQLAQQQAWQQAPGVTAFGQPASAVGAPLEPAQQQLTAESIGNMSMANYARDRKALLAAASRQAMGR